LYASPVFGGGRFLDSPFGFEHIVGFGPLLFGASLSPLACGAGESSSKLVSFDGVWWIIWIPDSAGTLAGPAGEKGGYGQFFR